MIYAYFNLKSLLGINSLLFFLRMTLLHMLCILLILVARLTLLDMAVKRDSIQNVLFNPVQFVKLLRFALRMTFVFLVPNLLICDQRTLLTLDLVASIALSSVNGHVLANFADKVLEDLLHIDLVSNKIVLTDINFGSHGVFIWFRVIKIIQFRRVKINEFK